MKKRGIFSLVLLLTFSTLFAAQDFTDIGTAYELVISDTAFADAETNSSSTVSIINRDQIESYNAQTTAELVNKAIGTNFNSYGGLGSLQTVVIRGASSAKNQIYLDGVLISSAHDGSVDLSIIPVSIIERIEVIKSGAGNLGRTNAIGGMINIITKQGTPTETPYTLTFENGSFLPLAYGSSNTHNYLSLVDSQRLDLTYANTINDTNLATNLGGIVAQNAYTFDNGATDLELRDNAGMYEIHGSLNADKAINDSLEISSLNMANVQHLGVPGSTYSFTPSNYQNTMLLSTKNSIILSNPIEQLKSLKTSINYNFEKLLYHTSGSDSIHNKYKSNLLLEQDWNLGQTYALITGTDISLDYVDSTTIGQKTRLNPSLYANGSIYLLEGKISLHPSANLAYLSDTKTLSPNASFGAIYNLNAETSLKTTLSYAENPPTFSDLYWPFEDNGIYGTFQGNPDLKTEKGFNADIGASYKNNSLSYEGAMFGRNIYNAIVTDYSVQAQIPGNIAHSVYLGTEQSVSLEVAENLSLSASYQYNKSFDLSNGQTFADDIEVSSVRKHTAKASLSYTYTIFNAVLSGEFLGKSTNREEVVLLNLSVNAQINNYLKAYVAIDNLLNASYALQSGGYPMPGTKIRIGGNWKF